MPEQSKRFINGLKKEIFGSNSLNLTGFKRWCESRREIPEDIDQLIVPSQDFS